jgi:hypothetical protein
MARMITRKGSLTFSVLESLYLHGPQTPKELVSRFDLRLEKFIYSIQANHKLLNESGKYTLTPTLRKYFDDLNCPPPALSDPTPARKTNVYSPEMRGYDAMMRNGRVLRDMPCKASGTSQNLYRGL